MAGEGEKRQIPEIVKARQWKSSPRGGGEGTKGKDKEKPLGSGKGLLIKRDRWQLPKKSSYPR